MKCWALSATLVSSLAFLALLTGCAPTVPAIRLYAGPEKSRSEVATIAGSIESVDGRVITGGHVIGVGLGYVKFQQFAVLPGRHIVVVRTPYPHAARWMPECTIEFEAQPGESYGVFSPTIVHVLLPSELLRGPSVRLSPPGLFFVTKAAQASSTDAFKKSLLRTWLMSGRDSKPETHRLRSGETFFADFPEAVWRYYFQVSDSIAPDQLRLAFADVPPLRLPNVTFAD